MKSQILKKKLEATDSTPHDEEPVYKNCGNVSRTTGKFCDKCGTEL